jgi:MFS family permease
LKDRSVSSDFLAGRVPFFYGWIIVPVVMVVQICTSPGQTYGISVFNPYLREALALSQAELSGAYMAGTFLASLPMTYIGALMDRYGPGRALMVVVVLFGLACMGMTQVDGLFSLFFAFLFLRMLGQGAMGLLALNSVALWFNRRLGTVSGLMSVGSAVALGGVPALNLWLIHGFGWRWSYAVLGVAVWLLVLPVLAIFFRDKPEEVGQRTDGRGMEEGEKSGQTVEAERRFTLREAVRTRAYWIMAGATAFWSMSTTGVHFHTVQIFLDRGLSEAQAAGMFTVYAMALASMRFVGGVLADRLPLNGLLAVALGAMAAGFALLTRLSTPFSAHLFAVVLGGSAGGLMAVSGTIWVRYYGRPHLGKIVGSLTTVGVAFSSFGPFAMGTAHDLFGGYDESLWIFVVICVPLALAGLLATPPESGRGTGEKDGESSKRGETDG